MNSQNVFPKKHVIGAARRKLVEIRQERERMKEKLCSNRRKYGSFGRTLTVEEAWQRLSPKCQEIITTWDSKVEEIVECILAIAERSIGDTINLGLTEFAILYTHWE